MAALVSRSAKVRLSAAVIGGLLNVLQAVVFLVAGYPLLAAVSVAAVVLFGVMAALLLRGQLRLGCWLGYLVIAGHVLFMTWLWGRGADYWVYFVPLAGGTYMSLTAPSERWDRRIGTALPLVTGPLAFVLARDHAPVVPVSPGVLDFFATFNVIGALCSATGLVVWASRVADLAEADADRERHRSDKLLLDILPAAIATRLKDGESTIVDAFPSVSVLFADIVGFTSLSSRLSSAELMARLNEIFTAFDALADKHGLEKIKTIGDAYMVVGGVPEARTDHAEAIARMALDMRALVAATRFGDERMELRIGIHSGPVVAGVIGTRKFSYDLWGDTVNVASRMESHGEPGQIQVTETTRELLSARFALRERGLIVVKGRGEMRTYFLDAPA